MNIGCVKEVKNNEFRVGLIPMHVSSYVSAGHSIMIETGAGLGCGYSDQQYTDAGAKVVNDAAQVWQFNEMVIKVKEPLESEFQHFREGLIIFTYLHLSANPALAKALCDAKVSGMAYETITDDHHQLPLLKPMSEVAGRLSIQEGAKYLEKPFGGRGVLLSGLPGVPKGNVVIIGGGAVGTSAARIGVGIGANVTVIDKSNKRLAELDVEFKHEIQTLYATEEIIASQLKSADLVIGAVLIPGANAPKVIKRWMLKDMHEGSVIVDVAIDQGGCVETSHVTYHDDPVFVVDGVSHYCVANMPSATSRTSTQALVNATLIPALSIAEVGLEAAIKNDKHLANGMNTYKGHIVHRNVAEGLKVEFVALDTLLY
jgi:alanine dehydrogenase